MGMSKIEDDRIEQLSDNDLMAIANCVRHAAQERTGNSQQLLKLLRLLEGLHREIRDNLFQAALPESRQALYALLKDIEADGGWPYIHRMRLQSLLTNLTTTPTNDMLFEQHRFENRGESDAEKEPEK